MTSNIIIAVYWLIVVSIVLIIIAENRNPLKALPWILVVSLLPVVGILLYVVLGEDLRHVHIIDRRIYSRITNIPFGLQQRLLTHHQAQNEYTTPLRRVAKKVGNSPLLPFENLSIFTTGKDKFTALLKDLEQAKHHIHLEYYTFDDDNIAKRIAVILKNKVSQGVCVRIIYDGVGSWTTRNSFWKELRKNGIEVFPFIKVAFPFLSNKVNYRNHRKLAVIDGNIGYLGGMNVADRYILGDTLGAWRDTHFRFTGDAVSLLQSAFMLDWHIVSHRILNLKDYFPIMHSPGENKVPYNTALMQLVSGEPMGKWRTIEQVITTLVLNAEEYIDIETPYFLPTPTLNDAIILAALSGVRIRMIVPRKSDVPSVQLASLSYIAELMDAGVEVYFYNEGFLHSKIITCDEKVSLGGSANLDFRSLEHNFELLAIFYDEHTAKKLHATFEEDLKKSERIDPTRWANRSKKLRFAESVMRLSSPLF